MKGNVVHLIVKAQMNFFFSKEKRKCVKKNDYANLVIQNTKTPSLAVWKPFAMF